MRMLCAVGVLVGLGACGTGVSTQEELTDADEVADTDGTGPDEDHTDVDGTDSDGTDEDLPSDTDGSDSDGTDADDGDDDGADSDDTDDDGADADGTDQDDTDEDPGVDPPTLLDDAYEVDEDGILTVDAVEGLLGNDVDANGTLSVVATSTPAHGELTFGSDGAFTYTPDANYSGPDTFTYDALSTSGQSASATVTLEVLPVNDAPVAQDDAYTLDEDTPLTIDAPGVLGNDTDVEGSSLSATLGALASSGSVTLQSSGGFTYAPAGNASGTVTFKYQASDSALTSPLTTVTLTITPVNDAPVAQNSSLSVVQNTAKAGTAGATDIDSASLTRTVVTPPEHGTVGTIAANGAYTYTPDTDYLGSDSFTFKANDSALDSNIATITITVSPPPQPPVAVDDAYTVNEDSGANFISDSVLANDTDADTPHASLRVTGPNLGASSSTTQGGTVTRYSSGAFSYTPPANFFGVDWFSYTVADSLNVGALTDSGSVAITVTGVQDAPTVENLTVTVESGVPSERRVYGTDVDRDTITFAVVTPPADITLDAFDAATGVFGLTATNPTSFTFNASDGLAASGTGTLSVNVRSWGANSWWPLTQISTGLAATPTARWGHTAVWTGEEVLVFGGMNGTSTQLQAVGGRYSARFDDWRAINTTNQAIERFRHTAVWTGTEMIVWGGYVFSSMAHGARYNPVTDTWTAVSTVDQPVARHWHNAVWTGSEMLIWGGVAEPYVSTDVGGAYDPETDTWRPISTENQPSLRARGSMLWTGSEALVWGGVGINDGGRYNPDTDTWAPMSQANQPIDRMLHAAVWTGSQMIVWGGRNNDFTRTGGGMYDPANNTWTTIDNTNAPSNRTEMAAVWTGTHMLVWGGRAASATNTGGLFNPATNTWVSSTATSSAPGARFLFPSVWTGEDLFVWGGNSDPNTAVRSGARYRP